MKLKTDTILLLVILSLLCFIIYDKILKESFEDSDGSSRCWDTQLNKLSNRSFNWTTDKHSFKPIPNAIKTALCDNCKGGTDCCI